MSNRKFVNYAHRGASTYCPENTMLSFYTGIYMGANGIETDVQKTKDGVIVLFHDDTLNRILGIDGSIADYTYEELLTYDVKNGELRDKIPTLEDFLTHFAHFDLTFAIELKVQGIEREVAKIIRKHGVEEKVVITSFIYDAVKEMRRVAPELKCGLLKRYFANPETDAVLENAFTPIVKELISLGFAEICPIGEDCKPGARLALITHVFSLITLPCWLSLIQLQ